MKKLAYIFFLLLILAGCAVSKHKVFDSQKKQIHYSDSIEGYSFTRSNENINSVQLLFLKQFKDTIEIYLNNKKVDSFFKDDYHYNKNGEEYIIEDEAPNIEVRSVALKRNTINTILILVKPSNVQVSFEIKKGYDNYLVSRYGDNWFFTGLKSKVKRTVSNTR